MSHEPSYHIITSLSIHSPIHTNKLDNTSFRPLLQFSSKTFPPVILAHLCATLLSLSILLLLALLLSPWYFLRSISKSGSTWLERRLRVQRTALPSEAVVGRVLSTGRLLKGVVLGSLLVLLLARARLLLSVVAAGVVCAAAADGRGLLGLLFSGLAAGVGV
jgi:hypothetical protein